MQAGIDLRVGLQLLPFQGARRLSQRVVTMTQHHDLVLQDGFKHQLIRKSTRTDQTQIDFIAQQLALDIR